MKPNPNIENPGSSPDSPAPVAAETGSELSIINPEQFSLIIAPAPEVLAKNKSRVEKAQAHAQGLLDTVEATGMNEELDAAINNHLVRVAKTIPLMNDDRKKITQVFDLIRTQFTSLEAQLKVETKGSLNAQLQEARNKYAKQKAEEQKKADDAIKRKLEVDKEIIRLTSDCSEQLSRFFNAYMSKQIEKLNEMLNTMSIEHFDSETGMITHFKTDYPHEHFESFSPELRSVFASPDDKKKIIIDTTKGKFGEFTDTFRKMIEDTKHQILDRVPSKRIELQEIAKASADKAAQIKEQARIREENDRIRLAEEQRKREEESKKKIDVAAQSSMTETLFSAQTAKAAVEKPAAKIKEGYQINVLNALGYLIIAQFYFEHEGKDEPVEKLEKKTLAAMKKFCEKFAFDKGEKIESVFLSYEETFKAQTK